jgi:hypothetical protein
MLSFTVYLHSFLRKYIVIVTLIKRICAYFDQVKLVNDEQLKIVDD